MTSQVIWCQEAHFSPENTSAAQARVFVASQLNAHELPYLIDNVELVVSELVTNVLVHAHSAVSVTLEELPFCVRLTVHNGSSSPAMVKNARSTDEGGRGRLVIDRCSADWGIDTATNGDKSVWALFEMHTPSYESWAHPTTSAQSVPQRLDVEGRNVAHPPPSRHTERREWSV